MEDFSTPTHNLWDTKDLNKGTTRIEVYLDLCINFG